MARTLLVAMAALLLAGCASDAPGAAPGGTVAGRVVSAPSCPVQRARVPCPPRPVSGATVEAMRAGQVVASTQTDEQGSFELTLPAGRCTVRATNTGGIASTASRVLTVHAGATVTVRLIVDSGIR